MCVYFFIVMFGAKRVYDRVPFAPHNRWDMIEYSWPDGAEVVVLENIWRNNIRVSQFISIAIVFWHKLPLDLIRLIFLKQNEKWHVTDVLPLKEGHHTGATVYKIELQKSKFM